MPSPRRRGGAIDAPRAVDALTHTERHRRATRAPRLRRARRRSHIKGLLINCLHHFWPSLLEIPGFLRCFITPIVKATSNAKKGPSKTFFTVPEYEAWKDSIGSNASKFSVKYYKGLGTSTAAEARDYFSDLATHQLDFDLLREGDGDLVDMAFSKKRVEDRKTWLRSLEPGAFVDYGVDALAYKDFVRSPRFEVLRCLHFIQTTRGHQTRPFGPRRATAMLRAGSTTPRRRTRAVARPEVRFSIVAGAPSR